MTRHNEQHSAGKLSSKQLYEMNYTTTNKIKELTETITAIIQTNEEEETKLGQIDVNDASPIITTNSNPSRSTLLANQLNSRLTLWLPSSHTLSDPLYPQLMYAFVLDSVFAMYSPKLHHRMIRLIANSTSQPSPSPSASPELTGMKSPTMTANLNNNPAPLISTHSRSSLFNFPLNSAPFVDRLIKDFTASKPAPKQKTRPQSPQTLHTNIKQRTENEEKVEPDKINNSHKDENNKIITNTSAAPAIKTSTQSVSLSDPSNLTIKTNSRTSNGSAISDVCHVCQCSWFTAHPFSGPLCRNCFHDHRGWLTEKLQPQLINTSDGDAPIDVGDIIATVDDDSADEEEIDEISEDGDFISGVNPDDSSEWPKSSIAMSRTRSTPAMPPSQYHTEGFDNTMRQSNSSERETSRTQIKQSNSADQSNKSGPAIPLLRTHPYDIDALLPPSLDLSLFQELFAALDPQHVLTLLAALFGECQIILTSSSLYRIKSVINSITRLMYPFVWQNILIPLIPRSSIDLLACHSPYIIGVHSSIYDGLTFSVSHSPVIVELDKNTIKFGAGSFLHLPSKAKNKLYKAIVKFQSAMFLMQATNGNTMQNGGNQLQPSPSPTQ